MQLQGLKPISESEAKKLNMVRTLGARSDIEFFSSSKLRVQFTHLPRERARRTERWPARARAVRRKSAAHRLQDVFRHGDRRARLGRPSRASPRAPRDVRQVRGAFPRDGNSAFLAEPARAKRRDKTVAPAAPARRDRSNLPPPRPNAGATIPTCDCRSNPMQSFISMGRLFTAANSWELKRIAFEIESYIQRYPQDVDARMYWKRRTKPIRERSSVARLAKRPTPRRNEAPYSRSYRKPST